MADRHDIFHLTESAKNPDPDIIISSDGKSMVVTAVLSAIDPVQKFIKEKLFTYGCTAKTMGQIRLAVEEILANIISYAYHPEIGKAEVRCEVHDNPLSVEIQFLDSGKPFDPLKKEDADVSGQMFLDREGGFGIHLIKNTMDAVDYRYENGKNILTIHKSL